MTPAEFDGPAPTLSGAAATDRTNDSEYDVAILGAGSAGFAAAIRAVELGARVAMVEEGVLGGTCVNVGCVPSKTLIRAGEARHRQIHHPFNGVGSSEPTVDWDAIREGKDDLVEALRRAKYEDVLTAYPEIQLIRGRGSFDASGTLSLSDGTRVNAAKTVVVTGSSAWIPEIPGLADSGFLTSTELLEIKRLPKSLGVLGAGSVGLELAQAYARLGVRVTILARSRLLSKYDPDVGEEVKRHLAAEGIDVVTGASVEAVEGGPGGRTVTYRTTAGVSETVVFDELLIAVGRRANTLDMGLEEAGVALGAHGEIQVDEGQRTTNARVFAAGDVTGGPMHVYVAAQAGQVAASNALGASESMDLSVLPEVVFTDPAVAVVGLSETAATAAGGAAISTVLALEHVPRALAARDTRGFVKLVADQATRKIIGAQIVAPEAGEMIMEPAMAIRFGLTIDDLTSLLHPYLTLAEGIKLAALTFDRDVGKLSCCAV